MEASFIIFRVNPYFENFGKRVIKSPKYYFTEVGLLIYLLEIETAKQVQRDPLVGHIFENLIVIECLKARLNQGKQANLYFFRDSNQNEIDLIYKHENQMQAIEIKSAMTYHPSLTKNLHKSESFLPESKGHLIYNGESRKHKGIQLLHFKDTHKAIK